MIPERLSRLRREMEQRRIDVYVVPTADFHEAAIELIEIPRRSQTGNPVVFRRRRQTSN